MLDMKSVIVFLEELTSFIHVDGLLSAPLTTLRPRQDPSAHMLDHFWALFFMPQPISDAAQCLVRFCQAKGPSMFTTGTVIDLFSHFRISPHMSQNLDIARRCYL